MNVLTHAYHLHKLAAHEAFELYASYCGGKAPPRVAGCDTVIRLAVRIHNGKTVPEAAMLEYLYRWKLAIKTPDQCIGSGARNACCSVFGAPHTIGL
jgi:hypothetical protein